MKKIIFYLLIISLIVSCKHQQKVSSSNQPVPLILVSKDYNNTHEKWLSNSVGNHNLKCVNMYAVKSSDSINLLLKKADGIIISGGEDVNPSLYGKQDEIERCGTINPHRDSLEQKMIRFAVKNKIPLLGICRGDQILNVTEGGSLLIDI
ncbi:MAG: gamma-glutamyl-gamma-aminobutyrate hydrolase family protein, partial [Bacteroidales bacterium]|nr:gamma-glutamyl-gamma-aminobutyrate hydrolase family protein [Bacteroidales bacterium]